jgi:hypothetical protein
MYLLLLDGPKLIPQSNFITIWSKRVGDIQSDLRVSYYTYFHAFASVKFCILTNSLVFGSILYKFNKGRVVKIQFNNKYFVYQSVINKKLEEKTYIQLSNTLGSKH